MSERCTTFRKRLSSNELIVGTFLKTPSSIVAEVLGLTPLDAVAIDVEHAPFGRLELDQCLGALRSADMPSLVRVSDDSQPTFAMRSTVVRRVSSCRTSRRPSKPLRSSGTRTSDRADAATLDRRGPPTTRPKG